MNEMLSMASIAAPAAIGGGESAFAGATPSIGGARFGDWLVEGAQALNDKVASANVLAAQFAVGGDMPPHQVVLALEEARLSFQLAMQVRARLLEGYQELMRMQL